MLGQIAAAALARGKVGFDRDTLAHRRIARGVHREMAARPKTAQAGDRIHRLSLRGARRSNAFFNAARPRLIPDLTVPAPTPKARAPSWEAISSLSRQTIASRNASRIMPTAPETSAAPVDTSSP